MQKKHVGLQSKSIKTYYDAKNYYLIISPNICFFRNN